ncbi:SDR family oxidoreductase [Pseudomonas sp. PhalM4]
MPEVAFPEGYQRALVTGATSGIGKAIVLALRDAGLQVIAVGRSPEALAELACEPGVTTLQADVRDYRSLAAALEGQAVDVLVNNAGILSTRAAFRTSTKPKSTTCSTSTSRRRCTWRARCCQAWSGGAGGTCSS